MQTLVFNTTDKTVQLYESGLSSQILFRFVNIQTVKPIDGFYEVKQATGETNANGNQSTVPILRTPISNTNMLIEK